MAAPGATRISRRALASRIAESLNGGSVLLVAGAGYGKTTALEEAETLTEAAWSWIAVDEADTEPSRLLSRVIAALRDAAPGVADVIGDALAGSPEPIDLEEATAALLRDVGKLLLDPLVLAFDDAERLADAPDSLQIVDSLLGASAGPLSIAIATRRSLPLRLARMRAAGALLEIGPADLAFSPAECEEILGDAAVADPQRLERLVTASEGWPLGVALAKLAGPGAVSPEPVPSRELFGYLAEEVLDRIDEPFRSQVLAASVPPVLIPEVLDALGFGEAFVREAGGRGLFLRTTPSGEKTFHPLFREFLRERFQEATPAAERKAVEARVAEGLAAAGRTGDAVDHWLAAERFDDALGAIAAAVPVEIRTSPSRVRSWLDFLPAGHRSQPAARLVDGQLLWVSGDHAAALPALREAVAGFDAGGDLIGAWGARLLLADTLLFLGDFDGVIEATEGWDQAGEAIELAAAVAWYGVVALSTLGRLEETRALAQSLRDRSASAAQFGFLEALAEGGADLAAGREAQAMRRFRGAVADLEVSDPAGRLPYAMGMVLVTLRLTGERAAALDWAGRCEAAAERLGMRWALRDFRLQQATLLAQDGDLAGARAALATAEAARGDGWRGAYRLEAETHVSLLAGEREKAAAAGAEALHAASLAPTPWRVLIHAELALPLARVAGEELVATSLAESIETLDGRHQGDDGRLSRAWLGAALAAVEAEAGGVQAEERFAAAWEEAGACRIPLLRFGWEEIREPALAAVQQRLVDVGELVDALAAARPGAAAVAEMRRQSDPDVRRAGLLAALRSSHPSVLAELGTLEKDDDPEVAGLAAAVRARAAADPPPLRFSLLGGFSVDRAGWPIPDSAWQRPMAARVVRYLLLREEAVSEDDLFEAFWPDRPAGDARKHLAVALSRARGVLDVAGSSQSLIDSRERTYRLVLRENDAVDLREFEKAAAKALDAEGEDRLPALEAAATLWGGEPLPEDRYDEWADRARRRLLETYESVLLALLSEREARREDHSSIAVARELLELDPANEVAHRALMRAFSRTGRTSNALRQYLECRRALVDSAGIEPSAASAALHAAILAGEPV